MVGMLPLGSVAIVAALALGGASVALLVVTLYVVVWLLSEVVTA